jgi:hypothetical protein
LGEENIILFLLQNWVGDWRARFGCKKIVIYKFRLNLYNVGMLPIKRLISVLLDMRVFRPKKRKKKKKKRERSMLI